MKLWNVKLTNSEDTQDVSKQLNISPMAAGVLTARGYSGTSAAEFLSVKEPIYDPFLLKGMEDAVRNITEHVELGNRIVVYGDYDCDGVTSTAMLHHYLEQIGADMLYYIPKRENEGYGLNKSAIDVLKSLDTDLIITVDNGISSVAEVEYAHSLGIEVVITDHHMPGPEIPKAKAVVNPHQPGCEYPNKALCGAGVAFKLICALEGDKGYEMLEQYADLLAIGTLADVVDIIGENRVFVSRGIELMREHLSPGLEALLHAAGANQEDINSEFVQFIIAPRINSAGRMDVADTAVMLLLSESDEESEELASELERHNRNRRETERLITADIDEMLTKDKLLSRRRLAVFCGKGWHKGVIGIVAARMVSRLRCPVILIAIDEDGTATASGRSVEGFSLIEAIFACKAELTKYGGHPMAVGFSLPEENIDKFIALTESYTARLFHHMPPVSLAVDLMVSPTDLTVSGVKSLSALEPFGAANPVPVMAVSDCTVKRITSLSEGKHQKLLLEKEGTTFEVLFFSTRKDRLCCEVGDRVEVAFTASVDVYRDVERVSLKGDDIRPMGLDAKAVNEDIQKLLCFERNEIANLTPPTREKVGEVYRLIKQYSENSYNPLRLYSKALLQTDNLSYFEFSIAIKALRELSLIEVLSSGKDRIVRAVPNPKKTDLQSAPTLKRFLLA